MKYTSKLAEEILGYYQGGLGLNTHYVDRSITMKDAAQAPAGSIATSRSNANMQSHSSQGTHSDDRQAEYNTYRLEPGAK